MTIGARGTLGRACAIATLCLALVACDSPPLEIPRWVPPVPGPIPPAVAERVPLPFCGVATSAQDPVLRCLVQALRSRQPAEVGIIAGPDEGNDIGVIRLLPDLTVELLIYSDQHWQRGTCRSLVEDDAPAIINVSDCEDPVDLTAPPPGRPIPMPVRPPVESPTAS